VFGRVAALIQDAKGAWNDDEDAAMSAFRQLRSLYEVLWVNKTFSYLFPDAAFAPTLGEWLDSFLSDAEWGRIVQYLRTLPKYAP
jgi:hypothetical protein